MSLDPWTGRSSNETGRPAAVEPRLTAREALDEMEEIMRLTANERSARRVAAVRYTRCRSALIESEVRPAVPGFLVQCISLDKFHDFITLLDPNPDARIAFIESGLVACRAALDVQKKYDVFGDRDF
jgi:hypothetical protein